MMGGERRAGHTEQEEAREFVDYLCHIADIGDTIELYDVEEQKTLLAWDGEGKQIVGGVDAQTT